MADIVLFHSILGLRALERNAAARLSAEGHRVLTPDLFGGETAGSMEAGFALRDTIGWPSIIERARHSVADLPPSAVLGGFSFGAAIAAGLWAARPESAGILLLHGVADVPENASPATPMAVHLADPDPLEPRVEVEGWLAALNARGFSPEVHFYPGPGHLFTDPTLPDFGETETGLLWNRVGAFLKALG